MFPEFGWISVAWWAVGDNFGSPLWAMMFDGLQNPKIFDQNATEDWSPFFVSTIVMDIDRMIQVSLGLRETVLGQHDNKEFPICKYAKVYYERYVKAYTGDGHPETAAIVKKYVIPTRASKKAKKNAAN